VEYIEKKYETTVKALANLRKGVERFESIKGVRKQDEDEYLERRDSLIKRFELAFDTTWKYVKIFLEVKTGLVQNSPKGVFRECLRLDLISEKQALTALEMVDSRNQSTHTYFEELAEDMSKHVPVFYSLMAEIVAKLNPQYK
jgi:nucleotidyltransferase substrate binding protein (TIGR01987 family)